jgi:hypothetical protein
MARPSRPSDTRWGRTTGKAIWLFTVARANSEPDYAELEHQTFVNIDSVRTGYAYQTLRTDKRYVASRGEVIGKVPATRPIFKPDPCCAAQIRPRCRMVPGISLTRPGRPLTSDYSSQSRRQQLVDRASCIAASIRPTIAATKMHFESLRRAPHGALDFPRSAVLRAPAIPARFVELVAPGNCPRKKSRYNRRSCWPGATGMMDRNPF